MTHSTEAHDIGRARQLLARIATESVYKIIHEEFHHYRDELGCQRVADRIRREVLDKLHIL